MRSDHQLEGIKCACDQTTPKSVAGLVSWRTPQEKARWLEEAAQDDARLPLTRAVAVRFARAVDPNRQDLLAEDLFRFVRDSIRYVHDPSFEEFASSDVTLTRGIGDCDDKARCFVALCRSVGLDAHIRPVYDREGNFVHVQAVLRWQGSTRYPKNRNGWVVADLIVKDARLGEDIPDFRARHAGSIPLV